MATKDPQEKPRIAGKKTWRTPKLDQLGNLSEIIRALNPGKSDFGTDGQGGGGGEEMFML